MRRTWTTARTLADLTPPERNRSVDFLRAASILVVVIGHWLMAAPQVLADGSLKAGHLLAEVPWTQALTWVLQVMPIFFFVGGYANAASWRAARRDGVAYGGWLRDRLRRLLLPTLPLLAVWTVGGAAALTADLDPDLVRVASQAALVPVWFLATYVLVVTLVPVTLGAWERWGWGIVATLAAVAAAIDIANLGLGVPLVRWVNYLFVWNAVHSFGYAWADGRLGGLRRRLALGAGGLAALAALVAAGPYPLAMVGLDAAAVTNSNPPKVTLVALGLFQLGLATAAEAPLRHWLARPRAWTAVVAVNGSIMTLYLWHLTAMVAMTGVLLAVGGAGLGLEVGTGAWWATRPLWVAAAAAATIPLLAVFSRFERPRRDPRSAPHWVRPVLAALGACAGLGLLARFGVVTDGGLNLTALVLAPLSLAAGGVIGVFLHRDSGMSLPSRPVRT